MNDTNKQKIMQKQGNRISMTVMSVKTKEPMKKQQRIEKRMTSKKKNAK